MAKYTYFLEFYPISGELPIIPDKDAVYDWKHEGENMGFMRKHIKELTFTRDYDNEGTLTNASPFNTLWEWYFDVDFHSTEITLNIYKDDVLDYSGVFYVSDGNIDVNTGSYSITPIVNDNYKTLLAVMDDEIDVIEGGGGYTARFIYETTRFEEDTGSTTQAPDYPASPSVWEKNPASGNTTWVTQKSLYYDSSGTKKADGFWWIPFWTVSGGYTFDPFEFPNCYLLTDTIQYLLDTILVGTGLTLTLSSQWINNPVNYVTDEVNNIMNTLLEQRSDTKDPDATNEALIGVISLSNLMADLNRMFNVHWYLDGTDFVIEHEKFFYQGLSISGNKTIGIDLTDEAKYNDKGANQMYVSSTQKYESANLQRVKIETIIFEEKDTIDFRDDLFYLEYDVVVDVDSRREHRMEFISTDVGKAINDPSGLSDDGFYLFNCDSLIGTTGNILQKLESSVSANPFYIANSGFSVKWLLHDYYEYGRYNKTGVLIQDSGSTTPDEYAVLSTKPVYLQKDIVFLLNDADSIDINKYIATYLIKSNGFKYTVNGNIIAISHDLNDDFVTVTLGYEL